MKHSWMEAEVKVVLLIATAEKKTTFCSVRAITDTRTMLVDEMNSVGANDSSVINEEEGEGRNCCSCLRKGWMPIQ